MAADLSKGEALAASQLVAGAPRLKVGQSIMEQIGTPDHEGWMRKKGERYNTWKTRYFVLKGPHLYYLRNNSKSVRTVLTLWGSLLKTFVCIGN